jgi:hypothetical protein
MLRRRRAMLLCGVAAFFAYAYFYEAGGWNQNTRFDLVRALVEHHGIRIDDYQENTGDKAPFEGHVYADKAPGASFTAAPAVAIARAATRLAGGDPNSDDSLRWLTYVSSLAAAALPGAISVMLVWALSRRLGASSTGATVVALTFGLGSPFWAWASIFYGHTLAAACLLGAFLLALRLGEEGTTAAWDGRVGLGIGLLVGWAVVTEFPTAVPGAVVVAFSLWRSRQNGTRRLVRVATCIAVAGGACAGALGAYHYSAFHDPFHVGYASEEKDVLKNGFFGFTFPKADVAAQLLWGSYRGILRLAPALAFIPVGWWLWARQFRTCSTCRAGLAAAATFLVGFAMNASYEHWEGGWSLGPRHLGPVLGFAVLALVPVWMKGGRVVRALVVMLALGGFGAALVGISTTAQPPAPTYDAPISQLLWPAFRAGQLSLNHQSYFQSYPGAEITNYDAPRAAWNLGEKMGLHGLPSLLPLMGGLVIVVGLALRRRAD